MLIKNTVENGGTPPKTVLENILFPVLNSCYLEWEWSRYDNRLIHESVLLWRSTLLSHHQNDKY